MGNHSSSTANSKATVRPADYARVLRCYPADTLPSIHRGVVCVHVGRACVPSAAVSCCYAACSQAYGAGLPLQSLVQALS